MQRAAEVADTAKAQADVQAVTARREWAEQSATMNRAFHVRSAIEHILASVSKYLSSIKEIILFTAKFGQASSEVALAFVTLLVF